MSWSTELFCNISFNRKTYNSKYEVQDDIDDLNKQINTCKETIRDMVMITEPSKFVNKDNDENPYFFLCDNFKENIELLEELIIEKYKLDVLLNNWGNCHNKEGLAIYPPDEINWDTAYLHGDFIRSTKYPNDKSLLGQ